MDRKPIGIKFMSPEIITVLYVNGSVEEVGFLKTYYNSVVSSTLIPKATILLSTVRLLTIWKTIYYLLYRQTQKYNLQIDSNQL